MVLLREVYTAGGGAEEDYLFPLCDVSTRGGYLVHSNWPSPPFHTLYYALYFLSISVIGWYFGLTSIGLVGFSMVFDG